MVVSIRRGEGLRCTHSGMKERTAKRLRASSVLRYYALPGLPDHALAAVLSVLASDPALAEPGGAREFPNRAAAAAARRTARGRRRTSASRAPRRARAPRALQLVLVSVVALLSLDISWPSG